jgi:hypothetical protein
VTGGWLVRGVLWLERGEREPGTGRRGLGGRGVCSSSQGERGGSLETFLRDELSLAEL